MVSMGVQGGRVAMATEISRHKYSSSAHVLCCPCTEPPLRPPPAASLTSLRGRQRLRRWSMRSRSMKRWRESRAASLRASWSMRVKYTFITS